jgi:hypothetical protein
MQGTQTLAAVVTSLRHKARPAVPKEYLPISHSTDVVENEQCVCDRRWLQQPLGFTMFGNITVPQLGPKALVSGDLIIMAMTPIGCLYAMLGTTLV